MMADLEKSSTVDPVVCILGYIQNVFPDNPEIDDWQKLADYADRLMVKETSYFPQMFCTIEDKTPKNYLLCLLDYVMNHEQYVGREMQAYHSAMSNVETIAKIRKVSVMDAFRMVYEDQTLLK